MAALFHWNAATIPMAEFDQSLADQFAGFGNRFRFWCKPWCKTAKLTS